MTPEKYVMNVAMGAAMAVGFDQVGKLLRGYWLQSGNMNGGIKPRGPIEGSTENVAFSVEIEGVEVTATKVKPLLNAVNTGKRTGSAAYKSLNVDDAEHFFSNIVDNYASQATKYRLLGGDGVVRDFYQIGGSIRGKSGVFEWIVEGSKVTHRRFISGGIINGIPNQIVR